MKEGLWMTQRRKSREVKRCRRGSYEDRKRKEMRIRGGRNEEGGEEEGHERQEGKIYKGEDDGK